jgi:hypothetical protein
MGLSYAYSLYSHQKYISLSNKKAAECKQRSKDYAAGVWRPLWPFPRATRKGWPVFANAG